MLLYRTNPPCVNIDWYLVFLLGTDLEVQYSLMTFGIPSEALPVNPDGTLKVQWLFQQICHQRENDAKRMEQEAQKSKGCILFPSNNDILLGRGRPFQGFPGNLRLAKVLDAHRERYQNATEHLEKSIIAASIVKTMQESGARFLKREDGLGWELAPDTVAQTKCAQSMRRSKGQHKASKTTETLSDLGESLPKRARFVVGYSPDGGNDQANMDMWFTQDGDARTM